MARRKKNYNRPETRDPRYDSPVVGKLISKVMRDGKRSLSERIVYAAIDKANDGTDTVDPLEVVTRALENAKPRVEVKSRRVGGATFQIPTPVREERKSSLAMKWLIGYARKRNEKTMSQKLAAEIIAASKEEGAAFKKKEDTIRMAEANKAFSHFRF